MCVSLYGLSEKQNVEVPGISSNEKSFFLHGNWRTHYHGKGSLQESRGGRRAFKVARLQLEVEQVKNSDPESTLRIHNIAV